jgi:hypothetical protein
VTPGTARPCSIAQIWRPLQPVHINNGAWVSIDGIRQVFLKCLHPECQRLDKSKGLFIGHIPLQVDLRDKAPAVHVIPRCNRVRKRFCSDTDKPTLRRRVPNSQSDLEQTTGVDSDIHVLDSDLKTASRNQTCPLPNLQQHPRSREQSLAQVIRDNQCDKDASLQAWTVEVGPFGGRSGSDLDTSHHTVDHLNRHHLAPD